MLKRAALAVLSACALAACGGPTAIHQSATGSVHPKGWGGTPKGFVAPAPLLTAVPTQTMYDAVTVSEIPANPFAVAGYTAGLFHTWPSLLTDFPSAHHVSIAIAARYHADCLDVEPGDAVPSQAGAWALADIKAGFAKPCLYSDLSEMPAVKSSLAAAGLARSSYFLWLAWYRLIPGLVSGYDAAQWTDRCLGRSLDCSTVTLAFLSIAQPPVVQPKPTPEPPPQPTCDKRCHQKRALASTRNALAGVERGLRAPYGPGSRPCASPWRRGKCRTLGQLDRTLTQRDRWFAKQLGVKP